MKINAINRSDLIQQVADKFRIEPNDAESIVRIILEALSQSLISGERIEIRGFGSFELRFRPSRTARNPKTGATVTTKPRYSIHFKPGKEMRERVQESMKKPEADLQALTAPIGAGFMLGWKANRQPQHPSLSDLLSQFGHHKKLSQ